MKPLGSLMGWNHRQAIRNGSTPPAAFVCCLLLLLVPDSWNAPALADDPAAELARYNARIDRSVDRGLRFLASKQRKDGSFDCPMEGNTGVTSLCVMAMLARGSTPGRGPHGEAINRGIDFVLAHRKDNSLLTGKTTSHGPMYSHTISTLMLSEVSGMVDPVRQELIDEALAPAARLILDAQAIRKPDAQQGGWRYQHNSGDSDMSVTGWAVMALRSCRSGGAPVPAKAIGGAIRFVLNCRTKEGGFGYTGPSDPQLARTGTALLCLELCGRHGQEASRGAGDWILANLPKRYGGANFYYGMYYCSQGMFQLGGDYWPKWAGVMYELLLRHQRKDGSWPAGSGAEASAGPCYSTAMSVLALSVSYRQLPIYQR